MSDSGAVQKKKKKKKKKEIGRRDARSLDTGELGASTTLSVCTSSMSVPLTWCHANREQRARAL
jgi:hypothetical protein